MRFPALGSKAQTLVTSASGFGQASRPAVDVLLAFLHQLSDRPRNRRQTPYGPAIRNGDFTWNLRALPSQRAGRGRLLSDAPCRTTGVLECCLSHCHAGALQRRSHSVGHVLLALHPLRSPYTLPCVLSATPTFRRSSTLDNVAPLTVLFPRSLGTHGGFVTRPNRNTLGTVVTTARCEVTPSELPVGRATNPLPEPY